MFGRPVSELNDAATAAIAAAAAAAATAAAANAANNANANANANAATATAPDAATVNLPVNMGAACAPHDEIAAQLAVLKKLQTDGLIGSEEFENKKAELLGRM